MQISAKTFFYRILCGFFLGISVIAPGVSGSVMAIMMGVYRDLIDIASNPFKNFKQNIFYLLPMGIGALASLVSGVVLLSVTLEHYPAQSQIFFMGLIAGGLFEIYKKIRETNFRWYYLIGIAASLAAAPVLGLFSPAAHAPGNGSISIWYLCLAGVAAGITSIIPGMSVSMVLMLFGVYEFLLTTASGILTNTLNTLLIAAPIGICFIAGLILFSNVIKIVFDLYPGLAYCIVLGFMCGTLAAIYPSAMPATVSGWIICVLLFLAGLVISAAFQFLGKKFNRDAALD